MPNLTRTQTITLRIGRAELLKLLGFEVPLGAALRVTVASTRGREARAVDLAFLKLSYAAPEQDVRQPCRRPEVDA